MAKRWREPEEAWMFHEDRCLLQICFLMPLTLFYCLLFCFCAILELIFVLRAEMIFCMDDSAELPQIYRWATRTDFRKVLGFQAKNNHSGNLRETGVTDDISKHVIQQSSTFRFSSSRLFCCGSLAFPKAAEVTLKAAFTCMA